MELNEENLKREYLENFLSTRDLAVKFGTSTMTIRLRMAEFRIRVRTLSEACKIRTKQKPQTNPGRKGMPKKPLFGKDNPSWKGGFVRKDGYKVISVDGEQRLEHRYVWEQYHNKVIPPGHQVHHINGIKLDNRIENLLMLSNAAHQRLHTQPTNEKGQFVKK